MAVVLMAAELHAAQSLMGEADPQPEQAQPLWSWELLKIVGKGGSSTVHKARLTAANAEAGLQAGQLVAVKEIQTVGYSADQIRAIENEVDTMKELQHENIIKYLGTQRDEQAMYILMEYADGGSLQQYLNSHGALTVEQTAHCTYQILSGLNFLHERGITHRDIKGANTLLTTSGGVKLADFGASKRFGTDSIVSGLKGTPHWMAPEVIRGTVMDTGWVFADIWSVGCTVIEMLTAKMPYHKYSNSMTALYRISTGEPPTLEGDAPPEAHDFIARCCAFAPQERAAIAELLEHPFIHNVMGAETRHTTRVVYATDASEQCDDTANVEIPVAALLDVTKSPIARVDTDSSDDMPHINTISPPLPAPLFVRTKSEDLEETVNTTEANQRQAADTGTSTPQMPKEEIAGKLTPSGGNAAKLLLQRRRTGKLVLPSDDISPTSDGVVSSEAPTPKATALGRFDLPVPLTNPPSDRTSSDPATGPTPLPTPSAISPDMAAAVTHSTTGTDDDPFLVAYRPNTRTRRRTSSRPTSLSRISGSSPTDSMNLPSRSSGEYSSPTEMSDPLSLFRAEHPAMFAAVLDSERPKAPMTGEWLAFRNGTDELIEERGAARVRNEARRLLSLSQDSTYVIRSRSAVPAGRQLPPLDATRGLAGPLVPERPIASAPPGSFAPDPDLLASPPASSTRRLAQYPRHSKSVTSLRIPALEHRPTASTTGNQPAGRRKHKSSHRRGSKSMIERDWKDATSKGPPRS